MTGLWLQDIESLEAISQDEHYARSVPADGAHVAVGAPRAVPRRARARPRPRRRDEGDARRARVRRDASCTRSRTTSAARAPCTSAMAESETRAFDAPATEPAPVPVSYEHVERRTFGLAPHSLVAAIAGGCTRPCCRAARRRPSRCRFARARRCTAPRRSLRRRGPRPSAHRRRSEPLAALVDNARAIAGFAHASVRAWSAAGRRATQLRLEVSRARPRAPPPPVGARRSNLRP